MFWRRFVQKCGGFGPTPASTKEGRSRSFLYLPGGSVKCDRRRLGLHCCSNSGCFKSFLRNLRHLFLALYPVGEAVGEGKKDKCITFINGKLVLIHSLLLKCCIFHLYWDFFFWCTELSLFLHKFSGLFNQHSRRASNRKLNWYNL